MVSREELVQKFPWLNVPRFQRENFPKGEVRELVVNSPDELFREMHQIATDELVHTIYYLTKDGEDIADSWWEGEEDCPAVLVVGYAGGWQDGMMDDVHRRIAYVVMDIADSPNPYDDHHLVIYRVVFA
ncbi:MAG: hypothetical protein HY617_02705 [Candidatus Sungbacteria bacterium]|nr:hypothetical protein [Candidatus Sungbacteria bacterium]